MEDPSPTPFHRLASSERNLRFLDSLSQATRNLSQPNEVMQLTARMLGEHLEVNRCAYAQVEADQNHFNLFGDYNHDVRSIVGRYAFTDFGRAVHQLMVAGRDYVNADVDTDPRTANTDLTAYRLTQIQSVICLPLLKEGRFVAAMAVHQKEPRLWTLSEVDLVRTVVDRCWEALERIRADTALRDANQRLSLALSAGELCDWSWDAHTDLVSLSDGACALFGVSAAAPLAWSQLRELLHPDDQDPARRAVEEAMAARTTYDIEYRVKRGDATYWIAAQGKGIYRDDGSAVGMIGVVRDVTERRNAAEERRALLESEQAARREAEQAGSAKDEFLTTLSHELRTPLSSILGWVHVLRRRLGDSQSEVRKGLEVIERNARVQVQLIDDLLDVSRIRSGKLRLDPVVVPAISFVQAAIDTVVPAAEAGGVHIETFLDSSVGAVFGDAARLHQVVWNLLSNAIKFTPRGGTVSVALRHREDEVEIVVQDSGAGIEPDLLPLIFDRFRQADGSITRRHGGLGLGLSIVKHLAEAHGGTVHAWSAGRDRGTTMTVLLPMAETFANAPRREGVEITLEEANLAGVHVLVVDDEEDGREFVRRILEEYGAKVVVADGAEAALTAIRTTSPDVLVSDIGMPGVDGYELLRSIRRLDPAQGGSVPAIALTAFVRSEDRARALRIGYAAHIAKPMHPSELVSTVARISGRTRSSI